MVGRAQRALAMVAAMLLLLQGTAAAASALACMRACDEAAKAPVPSCHGEQKADPVPHSAQDCDGACSYVSSQDVAKDVPTALATVDPVKVMAVAVLPPSVEHSFQRPVSAPEFFETDSSPPVGHFYASHSLRAPPSSCA